ncbi:MAG: hypothetical protein HYS27_28790 [Deltaproteobacteria bacterium]|nr:hypothetical protein [Deltaproteobacteria bacterium]
MPLFASDPSDASLFDLVGAADPAAPQGWQPWSARPEDADFRILVLGTSISWGQGLDRAEKFAHLVARAFAKDGKTVRPAIVSYAHSGACIWQAPPLGLDREALAPHAPSTFAEARDAYRAARPRLAPPRRNDGEGLGECPSRPAHLWLQAAAAARLFERARVRPDLILLDGGANDFGFMSVVAPTTSPAAIARRIGNLSGSVRNLIRAIEADPWLAAPLVVSGYYQAFTSSFDLDNLPGGGPGGFLLADTFRCLGVVPVLSGLITPALVRLWERNAAVLRRCFNGEAGWQGGLLPAEVRQTGARFADPSFGVDDGLLSPESKIWGPDADGNPIDHAFDDRARFCLPTHQDAQTYLVHTRASFGHPNPAGAELYARAIVRACATV